MEDVDLTAGTVLNGTGPNGEVDLNEEETVSKETVSNEGTESKDGLNKVDLTDRSISNRGIEWKDGLNGPNEVSNGFPLVNLVTYVTGERAETA